MAIYKADIKADYTVIPNALAQDKRLSFEARGLLVLLLSMPANWHINKSWVEEQSGNCGRDKTNRLFRELQEAGYIRKKTIHDEKGLITGTDWLIYPASETSAKSNCTTGKPSNGKPATVELENRTTVKPHDGKPATIKETDLQNKHKDLICVLFEKFWKSFPKKMNKKKALIAFKSAFKKQDLQIEYFTDMLIADVNERISRNQLGFDKLHATTYLNNERWNDEHETNQPSVTQSSYKPNSIEAYNERLLAKYGHTATPVEREINPVNDFGLDQHQVSGSVYEPMDAGVIASDMGAGDHGVDR